MTTSENIVKFTRRINRCCALGCDQEGTVKIDLIDVDTLRPVKPKFFCQKHAPADAT